MPAPPAPRPPHALDESPAPTAFTDIGRGEILLPHQGVDSGVSAAMEDAERGVGIAGVRNPVYHAKCRVHAGIERKVRAVDERLGQPGNRQQVFEWRLTHQPVPESLVDNLRVWVLGQGST